MKYLFIVFFLLSLLIPVQSNAQSREFEILKNLELIDQIHEHLELYFVDEPETGKISKVAIDAMLKELDPYTVFYHESNMEDYRLMTTGEYGGIGALIRSIKGYTYIVEPYENQPAHLSGLKAGDKILSIDGKAMMGKSSKEVSTALKGPRGSKTSINIERANSEVKVIEVTREQIKIPDVPYAGMIDQNVGYVKLSSFSQTAFQSVQSEFQSLHDKGMEFAILDLRNNGGGLLFEAVRIVNLFVPKGELVVSTRGRVERENREFKTKETPLFPDVPLVILINDKSASASEIVAGSLQDLDRAVIVGQQSFGKGLVQRTYDLKYGSKLKVTISKYYTPSGRCVQRLEYYDRNLNDAPSEISDSLIKTFKTANGRDVIDGRGIVPDTGFQIKIYSELTTLLIMEDIIFNYVNRYVQNIDSIASPENYKLTTKEYDEFITDLIAQSDFSYTTISEKKLTEIRDIFKEEGSFDEIKEEFSAIEKKIKGNLNKDLIRYKEEIVPLIENEIVSRFYFQKGKAMHSFSFDPSIQQALQILKDSGKYNQILNK
jgi:carboxyl-terminal processing protease